MKNSNIISYNDLVNSLKTYMDEGALNLIDKYYKSSLKIYENMKRETGEDYIHHPITVAYILSELKMDPATIGSALLHEAIILEKMTFEEIENCFGEEIAVILQSYSKISSLKRTFNKGNNAQRYRRIIVGLSENPKALFITFANRLHNIKTIYVHSSEHQKEIIDETMNILVPIAHRLGVKKIMSELEDFCLKYTYPEEYAEILNKINTSKNELEKDLNSMKMEFIEILNSHNIKFDITSRVKSVRGIFNKIHAGKKWEDIYDLLGIRILVNKIEECYLVIGLIHSKYRFIPKRFKDFIANPKSNMYQSLHTTVFGINSRIYEFQVRTYDMNAIAETGVASHWSYKEKSDGKVKNNMEMRLESFRALIESKDINDSVDFFKNINNELKAGEIYVFTPLGDVIELPSGSTPIDFAYKIHSEVGNSVASVLVNNKIVKLDYKLEDGDIVKINTKKGASPSKNWLKFVKTEQARGRIRSYFYKKEKDKMIASGKCMLENEIKKRNLNIEVILKDKNINELLKELKLENIDDLYFNISVLKYFPSTILNKIIPKKEKTKVLKDTKSSPSNNILVNGKSNIPSSIASCCNPTHGEEIVGYVTKSSGIMVHSKNCQNINLNDKRIIDIRWNEKHNKK